MKKFILTTAVIFTTIFSFSQKKEVGTVYEKHPYIDIINTSTKAYLEKDLETNMKIYADTAKILMSGMEKPAPATDMLRDWLKDFDYYEDINVKPLGTPDCVEYKDGSVYVYSWWEWSGKSKSKGDVRKVGYSQFSKFDKEGRIAFEGYFGDFSKIPHE